MSADKLATTPGVETERAAVVPSEEILLRRLLWLRHGCGFHMLYGDDGEMQCNSCMIDFKRNSPAQISDRFHRLGVQRYEREQALKERPDSAPSQDCGGVAKGNE